MEKRKQYLKELENFWNLLDHLHIPQPYTDDPIPPENALSILETVRANAIKYLRLLGIEDTPYYKEISHPIFQREHKSLYVDAANLDLHQVQSRLESFIGAALAECQERGEFGFTAEKTPAIQNNKIFIVHGHDKEMKVAAAQFIRGLKLEPVILSEKPNKSQTIIEKIEAHSGVSFAIGLISPDDWWRQAYTRKGKIKRCPRQNVILETGYFIGLLGRENVSLLVKSREKLVYPSDYDGMLFNPYDETGDWKMNLALELHHAGFKIDPKFLPSQ